MNYLIDSNQLLYSVNPVSPHHEAATEAIRMLILGQYATAVVPQTLTEFWRSATRPADAQPAGLGMEPAAAHSAVLRFMGTFTFLPDTPAVFDEWLRIAQMHSVRGAKVHDARLVAVMWVYGIDRILTNNVKDFRRYPRIQAVTPEDLPELLRGGVRGPQPIAHGGPIQYYGLMRQPSDQATRHIIPPTVADPIAPRERAGAGLNDDGWSDSPRLDP